MDYEASLNLIEKTLADEIAGSTSDRVEGRALATRIALPVYQHLEWLHGGAGGFSALTVMNDGGGVAAIIWAKADDPASLAEAAATAAIYNALGYSIHVNLATRQQQLDSGRGGKADLAWLRALWVEMDDAPLEGLITLCEMNTLPYPSFALRSSDRPPFGGHHVYWLLDQPILPDDQTERILHQIAVLCGGDEAACDTSRNLRAMGSINWKPGRDRARVVLTGNADSERAYPYEAFLFLDPGVPPPDLPSRHTWITDSPNSEYIEAAQVAAMFPKARKTGHGWLVSCPVTGHGGGKGDRHPSLSIGVGEAGRVLLKCHGGCSFEDVIAALGLTAQNLFPDDVIDTRRDPSRAWHEARKHRAR